MKFNKWTVGLAAIGVVSLASAARADEAKMSQVQTALSNTTLSGYVDTSIEWNPSGGAYVAPVAFQGPNKANGFNLNVIDLALDKPEDEGPWAAGYHVELWFGPDASTLGTSPLRDNNYTYQGYGSDYAIRQAYITLRTPVGNGIDWKLGVFDTIIGYESTSSPLNPNYTHSYGYTMEPTTHTGLLATYKFCDAFSATVGIADSKGPVVNDRTPEYYGAADSFKTYMGSATLTAPQSWGWASGATLSGGVVSGDSSYQSDATTSWYVGGTLPTPNSAFKLGASFDYLTDYQHPAGFGGNGNPWALALYANLQASPKLSLNARAEWAKNYLGMFANAPIYLPSEQNAIALTGTIQYDLWANVLTRLEVRWDHASHHIYGGNVNSSYYGEGSGGGLVENALMVALQVVYRF